MYLNFIDINLLLINDYENIENAYIIFKICTVNKIDVG